MFKASFCFFFIFYLSTCLGQQELSWEFFHPIKKEWFAFGKAGSVQEVLMARGELPDAFFGENENSFLWLEEHVWQFRSIHYIADSEMESEQLLLTFPNIDTYGEISVNDKYLGKTANFFHPHQFDITSFVHSGFNTIKVSITPPVLFHSHRYENESFHFPAPNDVAKMKVAPLSRKPQYQFGWDWALRMNTIGFSKPAKITAAGANGIRSCVVNTLYQASNTATLLYVVETNKSIKEGYISSALFGKHPLVYDSLSSTNFKFSFYLENPRLWWPVGFGEPFLYRDTLKLMNAKGVVLEEQIIDFGVRTAKLVQNKDDWGTSFEFLVNDRPIFCKGANYIPQSVFPAAVKESDVEDLIDQMLVANFNMVRVWGGGYYPDDYFYAMCDKKGLMVWQDLMFACAMYPGDSSFLENVKSELCFQVPRITAHPSVVLINGNNEVDVAWKNWGFQLQYKLNDKAQKAIEKAYDDLFHTLANEVITTWTTTSYVHTSPLSNWGKDDLYNHGSQHYWGVWHGSDPMKNFATKIGRFNAEYGFQSFPEFSTLATFSDKIDWSLSSSVMKHHQKSYVGNGMMEKQANLLYGKTNDFEEFVYRSQLTQAHAVSSAIQAHRLDAPRCMGTLFWQLNDCWSAPTWSSIDYYGNWKALHYAVREDYRPLAILKTVDAKGRVEVFLTSDDPQSEEKAIQVLLEVVSLDGQVLSSKLQKLAIGYQDKISLGSFNQQARVLRVTVNNEYQRIFLLSQQKSFQTNKIDPFESPVGLNIKSMDTATKTAVIEVNTTQFLADFWLYSSQLGLRFDKNFLQLLPGKHLFTVTFDKIPTLADFSYKYR